MKQSPHLIWIKENNNKISFAPWLLGSTIFYKETDDIQTMVETFENYPIDTFCASPNNYQMLDKHQSQQQNNTYLQQLLSTEPIIDSMIKFRWYSLTNLHIQDS
jgi:acyl-coenzyme A synthetase/AMP-(fatty) acid ligase